MYIMLRFSYQAKVQELCNLSTQLAELAFVVSRLLYLGKAYSDVSASSKTLLVTP